jgi:hypothetical protein
MRDMEASPRSMWKSVERAHAYAETEETENVRRLHIQALRERVSGHRYDIDTDQVAEAVLRRLHQAAEQRALRLRARSRTASPAVRPA